MADTKLNIYQRMSLITNELSTVAKNLNVTINSKHSYKAVSEVDIINAVKPLEEKHGVYSYPVDTNVIQQDWVTTTTQYGDKTNYYIRLERIYRFVNIQEPTDYIEIKSYGDGIDSGDKATGKAMTYADKYALMKAYKISTGDDPDKDPSEQVKPKTKPNLGTKSITLKQSKEIMEFYQGQEDKLGSFLTKNFNVDTLEELKYDQAVSFLNILNQSKPNAEKQTN